MPLKSTIKTKLLLKHTLFMILFGMMLSVTGCTEGYRASEIIGKTSAEIIAQYGTFDCLTMQAKEDGLYKNCRCGYTIREASPSFLGKREEILYFITFDQNGIASECQKGYRPGG